MTLYRADPADGVAWITGAGSGIGRQIAIDLARAGWTVVATMRNAADIATFEDETKGLAGRIISMTCDVTDEQAMDRTIAMIEKDHGAIVLAIFNAGVHSATIGERLEVYNFTATFDVNVYGVIHGLVPVADRMREAGRGQIVLIGSVTSYMGLPSVAAYGATKAALNSIAQSLRFDFDHLNIRVQIVNPGFVDTHLTAKNKTKFPATISVEEASRRILKGIDSGGFEVSFPKRLIWPLKLISMLPATLAYRIIRKATGWDKRRYSNKRR